MNINFENIDNTIPQLLFLFVLFINFLTSLMDRDRNFLATFVATIILLIITYWGGFYNSIIDTLR